MDEECWLCRHNSHEDAKLAQSLMVENAGTMCPTAMAREISKDLQKEHPEANGTSYDHCLAHVTQHTINPVVKMSTMLRSLFQIREKLGKAMNSCDEEGNNVFDPKLVESYLKVQAQIAMIYNQKDTNKMMFTS